MLLVNMNADEATDRRIMILRARSLRRKATEAEKLLWSAVRDRRCDGIRFRRQVVIGRYVVDFCAAEPKLIVELDGSQHEEQQLYDARRTCVLEDDGYLVLPFWNGDVLAICRECWK
jgi:very-short-patch-repair endonuclease